VLSTNHSILQAIMEGGMQQRAEEEKEKDSDEELDDEKAQNKMVQSILSKDVVSIAKAHQSRQNKLRKRRSS
jgi:hypothetical protein